MLKWGVCSNSLCFQPNLFRTETQRAITERKTQQAEELSQESERLHRELRESRLQHQQTQQLLLQLQQENEQLRRQPITLPTDLPLPNHNYGPRMMAICMNLSKHIGFRPTETAFKSQKPKARFMNPGPTLRLGKMVSYHLSHHRSQSRQGIKAKRMNEWVTTNLGTTLTSKRGNAYKEAKPKSIV